MSIYFKTSVVLNEYENGKVVNKYSPELDPVFEFAEIQVYLEVECKVYGGSPATLYQPEEYPEADIQKIAITKIELHPYDSCPNDSLVCFLLNSERKKEIEKAANEYFSDNWIEGKRFENDVLQQASEEYEAYMEGVADIGDD